MAKKTNDETIDLLYVNKENSNNRNKSKSKNKNVPKKTLPKDDIINLDNEIIIGLTPKPVQKQENKKKVNPQKKQIKENQKSTNTNKQRKQKELKASTSRTKRIKIKILKWTSIFILLIGATILFLLSPIFNVKQIDVEGIQRLSKEEIINLSQIQLNENTFKIRESEVIERIKNNTYIENVIIDRELPSIIKITVKERQPQYIIEIANGNAYIDSKGYILEISTEKLQLPILIGYGTQIENIVDFQNTKRLTDDDYKKIEVINQIIESANTNSILEYITSIDMSDASNIKLNLEGEKKVAYLGDGSNANMRILYLKKIIEEESGKEGEAFVNGDLHKPKPYFRERV